MMANRYRIWRPWVGVLAVGALAFGLSLQGAPAGNDVAGSADRLLKTTNTPSANKLAAQVDLESALPKPVPELETEFTRDDRIKSKRAAPRMLRIKSATGWAPAPGAASNGRAAAAVGDPCSCDDECLGLTSDGGCKQGQCVRAAELAGTNIDGTCQIVEQAPDTWCDTGDPCVVGLCQSGGVCGGAGATISPCAKACDAGQDEGQNCSRPQQCTDSVCAIKPTVTCTDVGGIAVCSYGDRGRCCGGTADLTYTDQGTCEGGGGLFFKLTDPDDELHTPVRCPEYSSGVAEGTAADDASALSIVPPAMQCTSHPAADNFGAVCEIDEIGRAHV